MSRVPETKEMRTANDSAGLEVPVQRGNALQQKLRGRLDKLSWQLAEKKRQLRQNEGRMEQLSEYLELAPQVTDAVQTLGAELFEQDLRVLEEKLTIALNEVLKQPIRFRAKPGFRGNVATVDFSIERDGNAEDIRRGQGGSVHNVLSVGLRMFALTMLDNSQHRRFLMLDEQDCWLHPDLVPQLVKIVHDAGRELGYQVIMISHHNLSLFKQYADRIYEFKPTYVAKSPGKKSRSADDSTKKENKVASVRVVLNNDSCDVPDVDQA